MQITRPAVGKCRKPYLREGVADYIGRIRRYARLEHIEVREEPAPRNTRAAFESALVRRPGGRKSPENRFTRQPWRDDSATGIRLPGTSPVSGLLKCGPKCQDIQFRGNGGYPNPAAPENGRRGIGHGVPEEGMSQSHVC